MTIETTPANAFEHACIYCGSKDLSYADEKQGFGAGKAVAGAIFFGPLGLAAGAINRKKTSVLVRCNRCLKHFDGQKMLEHANRKKAFTCAKCGFGFEKWASKCPSCGATQPKAPVVIGALIAVAIMAFLIRVCA